MIGVTARSAGQPPSSLFLLQSSSSPPVPDRRCSSRQAAPGRPRPPQSSLQLYTPTLSIATRVPSSSTSNHSSSSLSRCRLPRAASHQKGKPHLLPSPVSTTPPPPLVDRPQSPEQSGRQGVKAAVRRSDLRREEEVKDMQVGGGAADSPGAAAGAETPRPSRYESQKRRDWHTFGQYLRNHRPPLELARCSGAHVLEFLRYLDQFGKTKVHAPGCPFFGHPSPPAPCPCPLRQAWGSLDALVGRLRAAFEEHGGRQDANPFGARAVRLYLREVRDSQAKARGIAYEKKRRKRPSASSHSSPQAATTPPQQAPPASSPALSDAAAERADVRAHVAEAGHPHPHPHHQHQHQHHHHHFFMPPHPQFLHGFSLLPGNPEAVAGHGHGNGNGNGGSSSSSASVAAGNGDEIALAMAAAAEAHAAGCMLPLSVFN